MSLRLQEPEFQALLDRQSSVDVYETVGEYLIEVMACARDALDVYMDGLKGAERAKVEDAREQVDNYIKQLDKAKKAGKLAKVFEALGSAGLAMAMIAAVVVPSPMTIAILVVTLVMFLEPMVSEAAGEESLTEQGMAELFSALSGVFGPIGAVVVGTLLMTAVVLLCTGALAGGLSAVSTAVGNGLKSSLQFMTHLPSSVVKLLTSILDRLKLLTNGVNQSQEAQLRTFLEYLQAAIMMAQAGVQAQMGVTRFEGAQFLQDSEIAKAFVDAWAKTIELINQDVSMYREFLSHLDRLNSGEMFAGSQSRS